MKAFKIGDNGFWDIVAAETKQEAITFWEHETGAKVESIEEVDLDLEVVANPEYPPLTQYTITLRQEIAMHRRFPRVIASTEY
jgi:hypothetical protein